MIAYQQPIMSFPCLDPEILIRTSGEYRLSNFLLYQVLLYCVDKDRCLMFVLYEYRYR
jgi:undecaprenyl diphosphate synthase